MTKAGTDGEGNRVPIIQPFKIVSMPGPINFAVFVPKQYVFQIPTSWGDTLTVNAPGVPHGKGDFIVCADAGGYPNMNDRWVVNGEIFPSTYDMRAFPGLSTAEDRKAAHTEIPINQTSQTQVAKTRPIRPHIGPVEINESTMKSSMSGIFGTMVKCIDGPVVKKKFKFQNCVLKTKFYQGNYDTNGGTYYIIVDDLMSGTVGKAEIYAFAETKKLSVVIKREDFGEETDLGRYSFDLNEKGIQRAMACSYKFFTHMGFQPC
jgi:hypothetical protein